MHHPGLPAGGVDDARALAGNEILIYNNYPEAYDDPLNADEPTGSLADGPYWNYVLRAHDPAFVLWPLTTLDLFSLL